MCRRQTYLDGLGAICALLEHRQVAKQKLKWNWTTFRPSHFVVFCFWKRKIKQLRTRAVAFPKQAISNCSSRLVVIARPTAIQIDFDISFWFSLDTLD